MHAKHVRLKPDRPDFGCCCWVVIITIIIIAALRLFTRVCRQKCNIMCMYDNKQVNKKNFEYDAHNSNAHIDCVGPAGAGFRADVRCDVCARLVDVTDIERVTAADLEADASTRLKSFEYNSQNHRTTAKTTMERDSVVVLYYTLSVYNIVHIR